MDFSWTEEQTSMREQAYKFGKEVVAPRSAEMDEKEELDWDAWKQAAEFGFQGMVVPQKYGGLDLDPLTICITMEGLGHGSQGRWLRHLPGRPHGDLRDPDRGGGNRGPEGEVPPQAGVG